MPQTWSSTYHLLNDSIIPAGESRADRSWPESKRLTTGLAEARRIRSTRQYWTLDLSNLLLSPQQLQQIRAAERRSMGIAYPVLCRIASWCRLEDEPSAAVPNPQARIGTGNGTTTVFQLTKTYDDGQGYVATETVKFPYSNYPDWLDLGGNPWRGDMDDLRIYVAGTEALTGWAVNREGGGVTFGVAPTAGQAIEATGGYLTKMLMPSHLSVKLEGPLYRIADSTQLIEPYDE